MSDVQYNENAACDVCGKFGAFEFDGRMLCGDCYESCGSCCPEFGKEENDTEEEAIPKQEEKSP